MIVGFFASTLWLVYIVHALLWQSRARAHKSSVRLRRATVDGNEGLGLYEVTGVINLAHTPRHRRELIT